VNVHHGIGWECLHIALDDHSRMAYVELLANERGQTGGGLPLPGPAVVPCPRRPCPACWPTMAPATSPAASGDLSRAACRTPPHPPLDSAHQWQSRALHSNGVARMGV